MSLFDFLREQVAIEHVLGTNGGGKVRCIAPDHQDTNPSMHLYDDRVHCYSCGFRGDVTDVWAALRGFDRSVEAALDLAREFGVELPEMTPEAWQKAQQRRKKEDMYLKQARACHGALEWHPHMVEWWEGRGFGEELREKFLLGTNKNGTEAVIPFWHRGRVQGLIRRKLEGEPKYIYPEAEKFVDGHRPLFVPASTHGEVFIVEGIVDALAIAANGKNAIAVGGTSISDTQAAELDRLPGPVYILPDADEAGAQAALAWGRQFFPKAQVCPASYGEGAKDIADTFARNGGEKTGVHVERLASGARDMVDIETEAAAELAGGPREKLAYATEHIVPLLARITPDGLQDATCDIVVDQVKGLKKNWLTKAIKDETKRRMSEWIERLDRRAQEDAQREAEEYQQRVEEAREEIDALFEPGVLRRLRDAASAMHNVYGDREPLELALLVALGAQLEPLPNGRPLGASILLTAEAGRGKNHIVDAAVNPLPEEFYFAFEIASGQSLYYKADEDPGFLKHTFAYPNEIEGAEALWEFLRPMLSKGRATKIVTAKDADGNMTTRTIIVEGPVTIAIPTIRNKTDEQLQTRLLLAELPDYPGRVKQHAAAVSEQLLPDAAATDRSRERWLWQEGLRQLTTHRRVVFDLKHPDFALDDDQVSHGARLWANLLGLMATHAWAEQKNRRLLDLTEEGDGSIGRVAIEATPEDYEAAYRVFTKVCKRTVVNLSDTHRKILGALYDLLQEFPNREGFTQREIAKGAGVSPQTVSNNKSFLVMSAKLMKQTEAGLALVEGADPSWWASGDLMAGLPTPEKVRSWWEGEDDPPPDGQKITGHTGQGTETGHKPHTYAEKYIQEDGGQPKEVSNPLEESEEVPGHVQPQSNETLDSENGLGKPNTADKERVSSVSSGSGVENSENGARLTEEEVEKVKYLIAKGMTPRRARAKVLGYVEEDLGL
jgi:DNA primase/transcriptional regulator with XRE-family HTH domain